MANQFVAFTVEQDKWICDHYWEMNLKDLTVKFNELFEPARSYDVIKQRTRKTLKLTHKFSDIHKRFLIDNYYDYSLKDLTNLFNDTFNQKRSEGVIKAECYKLDLHFMDNTDRLSKERAERGMDIGSVAIRNGYKWIKTSDTPRACYRNWQMLHSKVWQDTYGCIPKGGIIIFLDNDPLNTDISNLYCVSGKVHRALIKNKWRFSNATQTLLAIKICELHFLITQGEEPLQKGTDNNE